MCEWNSLNRQARLYRQLVAGAVCCLLGSVAGLAETTTGVVGFSEIDCPGGADTLISVPFHGRPVLRAALAASPSASGSEAILNFGGGANLPADLAGTHYVRFGAGSSLEGRRYPVTGSDATTVTISRRGDSFATVPGGAGVAIFPMWTLDALLPAATQTALHASGGVLGPERRSELLLFNPNTIGENLVPSRKFFVTAGGWREVASGYPDAGGTVLDPAMALVIRHREGDADTTFRSGGRAISGLWEIRLRSRPSEDQENPAGIPLAEDVLLSGLQLEGLIAESSDTTPEGRRDEVQIFVGAAEQNPEPTAVFFRMEGSWRKDGPGFPVADAEVIPAGAGIVVLISRGRSGTLQRWIFDAGP